MSFYSDLQQTVGKLIADKGQIVTLSRADASGSYNTSTSQQALAAPVLYSGGAVVLDFPNKEIDNTTILRGDRKVLLPVTTSMPEPIVGDSLLIGGVEHVVISVKKLSPAGTAVLYTLGARVGG